MSLMNRIGNAVNPHQTDAKRVLVVCSAGLLRSPTIATMLAVEFGYNTRAVGYNSDFALIVLDEVLYFWADEVVWVEPSVRHNAHRLFPWLENMKAPDKDVVLNIPDRYEFGNKELWDLALEQYKAHLALTEPKQES